MGNIIRDLALKRYTSERNKKCFTEIRVLDFEWQQILERRVFVLEKEILEAGCC